MIAHTFRDVTSLNPCGTVGRSAAKSDLTAICFLITSAPTNVVIVPQCWAVTSMQLAGIVNRFAFALDMIE
jgi:hypothetical protein